MRHGRPFIMSTGLKKCRLKLSRFLGNPLAYLAIQALEIRAKF